MITWPQFLEFTDKLRFDLTGEKLRPVPSEEPDKETTLRWPNGQRTAYAHRDPIWRFITREQS